LEGRIPRVNSQDFRQRTHAYALRIVKLVESLGKGSVARTLGRQLLRSGTSVGANYRAAARARSKADFIAKLGIVEEECDECIYWIELLIDAGKIKASRVEGPLIESKEILAMVVASINTARARR
jgi:four helix bundle protein